MMSPNEVVEQLKKKGQPVFGNHRERVDRLKKAHGLAPNSGSGKKGSVLENIEAISKRREERRRRMEDEKMAKEERRLENEAAGKMGDVEFENMIIEYR